MVNATTFSKNSDKNLHGDEVQRIEERKAEILMTMQHNVIKIVESFMQEKEMKPKDLAMFLRKNRSYIYRLRKCAPNLRMFDVGCLLLKMKPDFQFEDFFQPIAQ